MRIGLRSAACLLVAALAATSAAPAGAEQGVTVDPNSPSGKEYQLPLSSARRDAGGTTHAPPRAKAGGQDAGTPLFGSGLRPDAAKGRASTGTAGHRPSNAARDAGPGRDASGRAVGGSPAGVSRSVLSSGSGASGILVWLGGGACVLVLGGLLGVLLRRRRPPSLNSSGA